MARVLGKRWLGKAHHLSMLAWFLAAVVHPCPRRSFDWAFAMHEVPGVALDRRIFDKTIIETHGFHMSYLKTRDNEM